MARMCPKCGGCPNEEPEVREGFDGYYVLVNRR
jgi:hypothetical protein